MFALGQNYLKRELLAAKIINKRLSFWNHSLAFPFLSGLGSTFGNLVALIWSGLSVSRVYCRHKKWNLAVAVETLAETAWLMGCPSILELLLQIRKICGISDFGEFFLSISSISLRSLLNQLNDIFLWLSVMFIQFFHLVLYRNLPFL